MDTCCVRGDTVSQTNVLSFARINVIYLPELGGQLPPLTPRPVRLCHPPPRNANNIEPYTFVTLFPGKCETPPPPPSALRNTWMAPNLMRTPKKRRGPLLRPASPDSWVATPVAIAQPQVWVWLELPVTYIIKIMPGTPSIHGTRGGKSSVSTVSLGVLKNRLPVHQQLCPIFS